MFINRVHDQLVQAPELAEAIRKLGGACDATISVAQSARSLMLASAWSENPRPCLFVCTGEDAADRAAHSLAAWLGQDVVYRYPERKDKPWSELESDGAVIAARTRAISTLALGEACVVVASARALLRRVPPKDSGYWASLSVSLGDEVPFAELPELLVGMGYSQNAELDCAGSFHVHGDIVDVFPAQEKSAVRLEFFGDEIDRMRRMVVSTGQTIQDLDEVEFFPCREIALSDDNIVRAERALWQRAQESGDVAADLELIKQCSADPSLDRYLVELYGSSASPLEHISKNTLVVLSEPRALFDDCKRAYDELKTSAQNAGAELDGLYTVPKELDFGKQQRLTFASMLTLGTEIDSKLEVRQPGISGNDSKLLGRVRQLVRDAFVVLFAVPDRAAREHLKSVFVDEGISFIEELSTLSSVSEEPLQRGVVTFIDAPVPAGVVIPSARLAVLSVADLQSRSARAKSKRRVDPTRITFPFKPGDYVVHSAHGIAYFNSIVRQEVAGKERDYFFLEYAGGDKLYVPLEQVDRLTRYVGPDGNAPRLTRLHTADWSRVSARARASAKKLAFDLIDLYTRRSSIRGYAFSADGVAQESFESDFSYELTPDQVSALADIKVDMEMARPMDRLLCGDVGFGKTELALRAAFKCAQDNKQVMVLCPTTILAQQHFQTFYSRFAPYDINVAVLSRFVSPARTRKALEAFNTGELQVLIGTHRLLSADVNPKDLGLVIIDEEQRFGVGHKEQLKNLKEQVDVLTLSATPIPRTMQMATSGVRDMSLILTPPPGRLPVVVHVGEYDPDLVSAAIRLEMKREGQVYYLSNRVTTIEDAVDRVLEAAPEARVGVAHGKMSAREIEEVMLRFEEHDIDVLVATTIIENGIDNPLTNTLIIEDSQRLGLAQLYQLKGRVGRGHEQAFAFFMFPPELPLTPEAIERLTAISEYQELGSGMRIAMRDLEIRGAGSLMGAEQHGNLSGVGFDLFTSMLGTAVAEARGEHVESEPPEVLINLAADVYLSEDYEPEVDKRVLAYRRIASATELEELDQIERELEERLGALPLAGRNLLDRARIRIRCVRLGVSSVALTGGKLMFQGLELDSQTATRLKTKGGLYFAKTHKLSYPLKKSQEEVMPAALGVLEDIGGDDEVDEKED